jgi:hypothetical protein
MSAKAILMHGGWAAAVVAAFVIGSGRTAKMENPQGTHVDPNAGPGSSVRSGGFESDSPGRLRPNREESVNTRSDLDRLFGTTQGLGIEALIEKAFRDPNPITRRLAFSRLLESMTPENALALRERLVAMEAGGSEWRDFNYAWGALAGREAVEFAMNSKEEDLSAAMSGWASANPAEAIAMLNNLPEGMADNKAQLAESVIAGLADHDLAMATDLAVKLASEGIGNADNLIRTVANEAIRTGGAAGAAAWATSLADGPLKGAAMQRVAGSYVRQNPEEAASWVAQYASEDFAQRAIAEVGGEWGERDPVNALGWLESLPATSGQANGFRSLFGDWEDTNPVAASNYLSQMPPSPQRDAAVSGFARGYAWQDPQAALAWAQDISDPALRQQSLTQVGQAYIRRDPEGARAWLPNSGLPPESQQEVLTGRRR